MRIPAEVIPLVGHLGKDLAVERKAEPIGAYGGVAKELPPSPRGEAAQDEAQQQRRRQPPAVAPVPEAMPPTGERRKAERRMQQQPVLLDTRSKQGRRRGPGTQSIDIKV